MDRKLRPFALLGLACAVPALHAQNVLDGAYIREHAATQRVVPYVHLREADVQWHRRIWRTIDLRQKMNLPLHYPLEPVNGQRSLWDVIRKAVLEDASVTAYDPGPMLQDDAFQRVLSAAELERLLNPVDTVWTPSLANPDVSDPIAVPMPLESKDIMMYRLKEDWILDKQRGVVEVRIIGLAPMREVRGEDGELRGHAPVFWLYFPELRYVLANATAFNPQNEAEHRSLDALFAKRMFRSTVTAVSNVYGRSLPDYLTGVEALLEAERIEQGLFQYEHDLWNP
ncbi:MAG: gliding motility protein GldN [Flavobacteriales bacterium]|nr:gliding motility protein GldN [Flavobacteriales bacterium]